MSAGYLLFGLRVGRGPRFAETSSRQPATKRIQLSGVQIELVLLLFPLPLRGGEVQNRGKRRSAACGGASKPLSRNPPKRCQWQKKRGGFEDGPRSAGAPHLPIGWPDGEQKRHDWRPRQGPGIVLPQRWSGPLVWSVRKGCGGTQSKGFPHGLFWTGRGPFSLSEKMGGAFPRGKSAETHLSRQTSSSKEIS